MEGGCSKRPLMLKSVEAAVRRPEATENSAAGHKTFEQQHHYGGTPLSADRWRTGLQSKTPHHVLALFENLIAGDVMEPKSLGTQERHRA